MFSNLNTKLMCGYSPIAALLCGLAISLSSAAPASASVQPSVQGQRPPSHFVDRPKLHLEEITDLESERREAMTLFAIGRMKSNENKHAEAIRMFQRAHRLDPASLPILSQILPEAFELERPGEAVRYARLALDRNPNPNPLLAKFLAEFYVNDGDFQQALELYELLEGLLPETERASADFVRMQLVMAQLYDTLEESGEAANSYGVVQHARQNPADFAMTAEDVAALLQDQERTLSLMADCFLETGRIDEAESLFAEAAVLARQEANNEALKRIEADELFQQARILAARGNDAAALDKFNEFAALRAATIDADGITLLKTLHEATQPDEPFIVTLKELLQAHPENLATAVELSDLLQADEQPEEAAKVLQELLERLEAGDLADERALMPVLAALSDLYIKQRNAAALFPVHSRLKQLAETPEAFNEFGDQTAEGHWEFVQQLLDVADERAAENPAANQELNYGESLTAGTTALRVAEYESTGYDRAKPYFDQAIKQLPKRKADILLYWGMNLLVAGENRLAADVFRRGVRERVLPFGQPDFYYHLAGALAGAEEYPEALNNARRAAAMAADNPRILARLAWVQYQAGNIEESNAGYELIVRRFDDQRTSAEIRDVVRQARLVLSALAVDQDNLPQGEELLEQVLDEFPDDEAALNDLGYLWADQGKNLARAHDMIRRAVETQPENPAYLDSLGWVLYRLGQHEDAIAQLTRSVELRTEPDGVALDHLGDAYFAAGNVAAARDAWQQAVQAFDPEEEADKIQGVAAKLSDRSDGN